MRLSVLLAILPVVLGAPTTKRDEPAPLHVAKEGSTAIPGKYIVKFKPGSNLAAPENKMSIMAESADHVYTGVMQGFAGSLDEAAVQELRNHPDVS